MTERKKYRIITALMLGFAAVIITGSVILLNLYLTERRENTRMDQQLTQIQEEKESLLEENRELDNRIEQMLSDMASGTDMMTEQDTLISELYQLIDQIKGEIEAKEARAAALDQEIQLLEREVEQLEQKNEVGLLIGEKLRESRDQAQAEAKELQRKIDVLMKAARKPETPPEEPLESETEEAVEVSAAEIPDPQWTEAERELYTLLETGAPPRYVKDEDGSILSEYPFLEYAYYDITTGNSVTYQSEQVIYSASVIKAPFIYAVIREIESFEKNKRDYDAAGNPLWDQDGNPLFEGAHPNYDENGRIRYQSGEEKYNLDELWTFDPATMMEEGSGEIMNQPAGFQLTWRELIEYALLYSDNIAFAQIRQRFGYTSFYQLVGELGIQGTASGFMNLSADDCVKFLRVLYDYMASGSEYAQWMKDCMVRSKHSVILARNYPEGTCAHKYGWDIDAYHDAAVVFDEHPYVLVVMSNLHDGGNVVNDYFSELVRVTRKIHEEQYA